MKLTLKENKKIKIKLKKITALFCFKETNTHKRLPYLSTSKFYHRSVSLTDKKHLVFGGSKNFTCFAAFSKKKKETTSRVMCL